MKQLVLLILTLLFVSCLPGDEVPTTRPDDFALYYQWDESSLPPPYYYSYLIIIEPNNKRLPLGSFGLIRLEPDYTSEQTPVWLETFPLTEMYLNQLYAMLLENDFFETTWKSKAIPPLGTRSESLTVIAGGVQTVLPSFVIPEQQGSASRITAAVNTLVPQEIWTKLEAQREQYMEEYQQ